MSTSFWDYRADGVGLSTALFLGQWDNAIAAAVRAWTCGHLNVSSQDRWPRKFTFAPLVKHAMQAIYHQVIDQQINTEVWVQLGSKTVIYTGRARDTGREGERLSQRLLVLTHRAFYWLNKRDRINQRDIDSSWRASPACRLKLMTRLSLQLIVRVSVCAGRRGHQQELRSLPVTCSAQAQTVS